MEHLVTAAGWIGAALLLLAYAFVSTRKIDPTSTAFQVLNLAGSIGLTANSSYHHAWPSAALNIAWILIGLVALHRVGNLIRKAGGGRRQRQGGVSPATLPKAGEHLLDAGARFACFRCSRACR